MTVPRPVPLRTLLLLFVLSGAAGLIYEVVWARQLVLVFGNTSQAVSAILTGFFGGLAIGGVVGGRLADRSARPLRLYAAMELLLVVVVVVTPITFRLIGELYRGIYPGLSDSPLALALVRFVLAVLALGPATLLMGATLPTLTRFLTQGGRGLAGAFQRLYAANTIGAIVGTVLAGFVLIEVLGLTGALLVGAVCSGTAGLVALMLDHRAASGPSEPSTREPVTPRPAPSPPATPVPDRRRLALGLAFVSGLTSLGYQVVLEQDAGGGDRELHVRLHDHPGPVPRRHRNGRGSPRLAATSCPVDDRPHRRRAAAHRCVRRHRRRDARFARQPVQWGLTRLWRRPPHVRHQHCDRGPADRRS